MRRLLAVLLVGCATPPAAPPPPFTASGHWVGRAVDLFLTETTEQPGVGTITGIGVVNGRAVRVTGWREDNLTDVATGREFVSGRMTRTTWDAFVGSDSVRFVSVPLTRQP